MHKIAIALDILRQYNEMLEATGKETKIYAIDGYGERISYKALMYGYWYVFSSIYGSVSSWYGYPKDMYWNMIWGNGIIGWNRPVTNPTIDIPKALTIYTQLSASASSYKDKFSRDTALKKLFYRENTYAHNVFIDAAINADDDGYIQTAGSILKQEDPEFYEYVNNKLYYLWDLAANEAKNVIVPTKLRFLFDSKPIAKMYDALPTDESYKDGLLNMNSSVIQANQFYLTFLTSFEQIIYQYTKQTFPIKLFGTLANLYSSYVKIITNYVKPYHARLIDRAPILRFGGNLNETIAVGDILRLDPTVQIYSDVVRWRFDNPYDYRPDNYDKLDKIWDEFWLGGKPTDDSDEPWDHIIYYEDAPESGIVQKIEDSEHYYHRIDDVKFYSDNRLHRNDVFEDITFTEESINKEVKPYLDEVPFNLYPSSLYDKYGHHWVKKDPDDPIMEKVRHIVETGEPDKVECEGSYSGFALPKIVTRTNNSLKYRFSYDEYMGLEEARKLLRKYDEASTYKLIRTVPAFEDLIEYNFLNNYIENVSDRDLCIITNQYTDKDDYAINTLKFNLKSNVDIDTTGTKIGIFTDDMNSLWVFNEYEIIDSRNRVKKEWMWKRTKLPVVSDIFNKKDPPAKLHDVMILTDRNDPSIRKEVYISPCMHLSDNEIFYKKPSDEILEDAESSYNKYVELDDDGSYKLIFSKDDIMFNNKDYIQYYPHIDVKNKEVYYNKDSIPELVQNRIKYLNFIRFFLFIPAHTKAILPEIEYTSRKKI